MCYFYFQIWDMKLCLAHFPIKVYIVNYIPLETNVMLSFRRKVLSKEKTMFKNIILLYLVYYEKYLKIKQTKLI